MHDFVCLRCYATVIAADGQDPVCGACGYPGPDTRPDDERHSLATGDDRVLSGKAVAAMVLGITSLTVPVGGLATGITAIPLALKARQEIGRSEGLMSGRGQANAGLVLGIVGIAAQAAFFGGTMAAAWHKMRK